MDKELLVTTSPGVEGGFEFCTVSVDDLNNQAPVLGAKVGLSSMTTDPPSVFRTAVFEGSVRRHAVSSPTAEAQANNKPAHISKNRIPPEMIKSLISRATANRSHSRVLSQSGENHGR